MATEKERLEQQWENAVVTLLPENADSTTDVYKYMKVLYYAGGLAALGQLDLELERVGQNAGRRVLSPFGRGARTLAVTAAEDLFGAGNVQVVVLTGTEDTGMKH